MRNNYNWNDDKYEISVDSASFKMHESARDLSKDTNIIIIAGKLMYFNGTAVCYLFDDNNNDSFINCLKGSTVAVVILDKKDFI